MKLLIKKFLRKYFSSFVFFFRYLRYRIFLNVLISLIVGVLDGFGLAMFLPLLQMSDGGNQTEPNQLGNFSFILKGVYALGLELNIITVLSIIVIFFVVKGIMKFLGQYYIVLIQQYFVRKLRFEMVEGINGLEYRYFVSADSGRILNTATGEVYKVATAYKHYFKAFEQAVLVGVYIGFAFFVDAGFALLVTVGGGLTNFLYRGIYKKTKGESRKLTEDSNEFQGLMGQFVSGYKYLKATGSVQGYYQKLKESIYSIEGRNRKIGILNGIVMAVREPLMIIIVAVVIILQIYFFGGELGGVLISLLFFYRALTSLMVMQNQWNSFLSVSGSLDNAKDFQRELNRNQEKTGDLKISGFVQSLELKNAYFTYGDKQILQNVNIAIAKNTTIAFVGESGSGKTTLVNILCGLLSVDRGQLLIDNKGVDGINLTSFQNRIGYITQDPVIFNDTIFNNVTLWDQPSESNKVKFHQALDRASIRNFVTDLSRGEETILGNNGINLSGGQKQRLSIARELYKNIDILIMDEATSALDSDTELSIQQSIDGLKGQLTIIMIAHRLATIKNADRIVLLSGGSILESGSFDELIALNADFKRLVEHQIL